MAEEKKQYVLYEYLMYFWSKKIWFLIIPIITALIIASAIYVVRHSGQRYTGEARVYTGGVNSQDLTDTTNIAAKYPDADVFVSEKGQVKFTVNGKTQGEVQSKLDKITNN
ncbi:MAG: hypothetical protein Q8898_09815, partial [Bacillota bacterium]|nr:hypothetical protein [Bacillota bacterium]